MHVNFCTSDCVHPVRVTGTERLPVGHTCGNRLDLPEYTTLEEVCSRYARTNICRVTITEANWVIVVELCVDMHDTAEAQVAVCH